jgi:hypothetical protein
MEILDEEDVDALVGIHETSPPTTDLVPASPANADIRALEEHTTPLVETHRASEEGGRANIEHAIAKMEDWVDIEHAIAMISSSKRITLRDFHCGVATAWLYLSSKKFPVERLVDCFKERLESLLYMIPIQSVPLVYDGMLIMCKDNHGTNGFTISADCIGHPLTDELLQPWVRNHPGVGFDSTTHTMVHMCISLNKRKVF